VYSALLSKVVYLLIHHQCGRNIAGVHFAKSFDGARVTLNKAAQRLCEKRTGFCYCNARKGDAKVKVLGTRSAWAHHAVPLNVV
jgi:hypothetical protein